MFGLAVVILIFFMSLTGYTLTHSAIKESSEYGWVRIIYFVFGILLFLIAAIIAFAALHK
jgi:hypothetical protein